MKYSTSEPLSERECQLIAQVERLGVENAQLRFSLERLPLGLSMFDADDVLVVCNKRYGELWHLPEHLAKPGATFYQIIEAIAGEETEASKAQPQPKPGTAVVRRREWELQDGRIVEVVVTRMPDGSCIALHEDVTDQRRAERQIEYMARHDQLTGMPNRRAMNVRIEHLLQCSASGKRFALMCLDLDRFKAVNDRHGHAAGDELLQEVAARLNNCVRSSDVAVRLGGDEFAVIQDDVFQPEASAALADRVISELSKPFKVLDHAVQIGVSIGIALAPVDGVTADELMSNADLALYRAKSLGRGVHCFFEPQMDQQLRARRSLEEDLRHAVANSELYLEYQPLINMDTGRVEVFEALLRWCHPERGNISPAEFIPLAEELGLILEIGRWVLQEACIMAKSWPEEVSVAVNVSAVQLVQGALLADVEYALQRSGIAPNRLEVEITESAMMHDPKTAMKCMEALVKKGVNLAIDDFGTGYSSLSYLHKYPFGRIKIDRSFVHASECNEEAKTVLNASITLGRNLGLSVVVEGVETRAQLDFVRLAGADLAQGFYFSRPVRAQEAAALLRSAFLKS